MGFKIFIHAIRLVVDHLGAALRVGGLLYLVQFGTVMGITLLTAGRITSMRDFDSGLLFYLIVLAIVVIVANIWIAVAWHRYVLLDEMPGAVIPRFNGERMLAYFGRSLLVGLIAIGLILVASIVVGLVATPLLGAGRSSAPAILLTEFVVFLVVYVPLAIVLYRLALVLPAAAVGKPIRLGEAWAATSGASGTIVGLAILSVLCAWLLDLPAMFLANGPLLWVGIVWQTVVGWIEVMVGVSILTTLYGYYVERRAIT